MYVINFSRKICNLKNKKSFYSAGFYKMKIFSSSRREIGQSTVL